MTHEGTIAMDALHGQLFELGFARSSTEGLSPEHEQHARQLLVCFQYEAAIPITGRPDDQTRAALRAAVEKRRASYQSEDPDCGDVIGHVRQAYSEPLPPLRVRLYRKTLRHEVLLGEARINEDRGFHIRYPRLRDESQEIFDSHRTRLVEFDLLIRVVANDEATLFDSDVLFRAPRIARINVILGSDRIWGPSDYEIVLAAIEPRLDGAKIAGLTAEDAAYLSSDTGASADDIAALAMASTMANQTELPPQLFFALIKTGGPGTLEAIVGQGSDIITSQLLAALDANVIPAEYRDAAATLVARLVALAPSLALGVGANTPTAMASVFGTSGATTGQQRRLLEIVNSNRDKSPPEVWTAVAQDPLIGSQVAASLETAARLGVITQGHLPLVRLLTTRGLTSPQALASLDSVGWQALIRTDQDESIVGTPPDTDGDTDDERISNYAQSLTQTVELSYPTAALTSRLSSDDSASSRALRSFLLAHSDFDFAKSRVATYLAANPDALGSEPATAALVKSQLYAYERIRNLTPEIDEVRALVSAGLTSAQRLAAVGAGGIITRLGGAISEERAADLVNIATRQASLAIATYAAYAPSFHRATMDATRRKLDPQPHVSEEMLGGPIDSSLPSWETLFGAADDCTCSDCGSILSPGAYLVDLMNFVDKHATAGAGVNALDVLLSDGSSAGSIRRRPDLANVQITCDNTNTELPYVDLANEILENAVAVPLSTTLSAPLASYQTTWSSNELSAYPEHLNPVAYDSKHLGGAVYPWTLPFDLWIEEARTYLRQLGVELTDICRLASKTTLLSPSADASVSREQLGFIPTDYDIVTGTDSRSVVDFYGLTAYPVAVAAPSTARGFFVEDLLQRSSLSYGDLLEIGQCAYCSFRPTPVDPTASTLSCNLSAQQVVGDDALFGGLHRVVRLWRKLAWSIRDVDIAMRSLGVTPAVSDLTPLLSALAAATRVNAKLKLPHDRLIALWAPLDSVTWWKGGQDRVASTYDSIFQNTATVHVLDPATGQPGPDPAFTLSAAGKLSDGVGVTDHAATILAALSISQSELDVLLASGKVSRLPAPAPTPGSPPPPPPDYALTLENLSVLHRYVALAKGLRLAVDDLLTIEGLIGPAFAAGDPSVTETFLANVERAKRSRLSIAQLAYVLGDPSGPVAIDPTVIAKLLNNMVDGLYPIAEEGDTQGQAIETVVRAELAEVLDSSQVDPAMSFLAITSTPADLPTFTLLFGALGIASTQVVGVADSDTRQTNVLRFLLRLKAARLIIQSLSAALKLDSRITSELVSDVLHASGAQAIDAFLALTGDGPKGTYTNVTGATSTRVDRSIDFAWATSPFDDPTKAFTVKWTAFVLPSASESYTFAVRASGGVKLHISIDGNDLVLIDELGNAALSELTASTAVDLQAAQLYSITMEFDPHGTAGEVHLFWQSASTPKAVVPTARLFSDTSNNVVASASDALVRLHKSGLISTALRIQPDELQVVTTTTVWNGFDFDQLPLSAPSTNTPAPQFAGFARLVDLFALRDRLPQASARLVDVLRATKGADAWSAFALAANRNAADVLDIVDHFLWTKWSDERQLTRIVDVLDIAARVGVSPSKVLAWAGAETSGAAAEQTRAEDIRKAVKSKYDDSDWFDVAKSLRAPIREKQRDALTGWLIGANPDQFTEADDVYAFFLIDVQMCACQLTSRIVQATSTMQLYVQRVLLQLEGDVALTSDWATQWTEWRSTYRVWQANREIFFWPENWFDPALRHDPTPFFTELMSDLQQGELTEALIDTALTQYVTKLDRVSNLEIVAIHSTYPNDGETFVTHIVGRTRAAPHVHWYRTRTVDAGAVTWSPWEEIPIDINDDHVVAIYFHNRLWLVWPQYQKQRGDSPGNPSPAQDSTGNAVPKPPQWDIRLAWSDYKNGAWSPKRISVSPLFAGVQCLNDVQDPKDHVYEARVISDPIVGDQLMVLLWVQPQPYSFAYSSHLAVMNTCQGEFEPYAPGYDVPNYIKFYYAGAHVPARMLVNGNGWIEDQQNKLYYADRTKPQTPLTPIHVTDDRLYLPMTGLGGPAKQGPAGTPSVVDVPVFGQTPGTFRIAFDHAFQIAMPLPPWEPFTYADSGGTFLATLFEGSPYREYQGDWLQLLGLRVVPAPPPRGASAGSPTPDDTTSTPGTSTSGGSEGPSGRGDWGGAEHPIAQPRRTTETVSLSTNNATSVESESASTSTRPKKTKPRPRGPFEQVDTHLRMEKLFHPFTCGFLTALDSNGPDALYLPGSLAPFPSTTWFENTYKPLANVAKPYPELTLDTGDTSASDQAYSAYNWELFFHIPLLVSKKLATQQQFAAAVRWLNYIFDPTVRGTDPGRFWRFLPLAQAANMSVDDVLSRLASGDPTIQNAVREWEKDPFDPNTVAETRPIAYAKAVVRQYLDVLIGWADQLFTQDTIETINQATQLYVIAARLLGRRPASVPVEAAAASPTFASLRGPGLDELSDEAVALESWVGPLAGNGSAGSAPMPPVGQTLAFCVPPNNELLKYWDTVADRLYKIRHCQDIQGNVQQLPLFQPPIDPALLVRAAAAGIDIASALGALYAPLPFYRFQSMVQKATELCAEIKSLGGQLLATLEKRDSEELALLRSTQQLTMLAAVREVKQRQIDEANATIDGLVLGQQIAAEKQTFYKNIAFMNEGETAHISLQQASTAFQIGAQSIELIAGILRLIPETSAGFPCEEVQFGGANVAGALEAAGKGLSIYASLLGAQASLAQVMGGYQRRSDDWGLQLAMANTEVDQLGKQIVAAQIRADIAQKEIDNHDLSIEQEQEYDAFMRTKFTSADLYDQMVSQISGVYFQAYRVAYDLAKRAEKAFQFELASDKSFIQFGYWDSLKKGLLAGEQLSADLKRMEATYLADNAREYEITKHVSLALAFPVEYLALKSTGQCTISLPESLFDFDYPGHYLRRVKSAAVTIPCVTGPYASVNATVTLASNSIRISPELRGDQYERSQASGSTAADDRFADNVLPRQSIVTSSGQSDSGLFETNLRDERYLPFEGAGVISTWKIELRQENNSFDVDTVTDLVLHLRYTSRTGGEELAAAARTSVAELLSTGGRVFSARRDFPDAFYRFLHPTAGAPQAVLELAMPSNRFPFQPSGRAPVVQSLRLYVKVANDVLASGTYHSSGETLPCVIGALQIAADGTRSVVGGAVTANDKSVPDSEGTPGPGWGWLDTGVMSAGPSPNDTWALQLSSSGLPAWLKTPDGGIDPTAIEDIGVVATYQA